MTDAGWEGPVHCSGTNHGMIVLSCYVNSLHTLPCFLLQFLPTSSSRNSSHDSSPQESVQCKPQIEAYLFLSS